MCRACCYVSHSSFVASAFGFIKLSSGPLEQPEYEIRYRLYSYHCPFFIWFLCLRCLRWFLRVAVYMALHVSAPWTQRLSRTHHLLSSILAPLSSRSDNTSDTRFIYLSISIGVIVSFSFGFLCFVIGYFQLFCLHMIRISWGIGLERLKWSWTPEPLQLQKA